MATLIKYFGGKGRQWKHIIKFFPDHQTYVEPFGGGASVLLNKSPSPVEVYNDLNKSVFGIFYAMKHDADEFARLLSLTLYSENEFADSFIPQPTPTRQAVADYVRFRQSFGAIGRGFSFSKTESTRGMSRNVFCWWSQIDNMLPVIAKRLMAVQMMNRPAIELFKVYDTRETLFYLDPPYVHSTRTDTQEFYGVEMTDADHVELLTSIKSVEGKVILSGYHNELYDDMIGDWRTVELQITNSASRCERKRIMTEVIWMNFDDDISPFLF